MVGLYTQVLALVRQCAVRHRRASWHAHLRDPIRPSVDVYHVDGQKFVLLFL